MSFRIFSFVSVSCLWGLVNIAFADDDIDQLPNVIELSAGVSASFRGIDVANANEVWISGSEGTLLHSKDRGQTMIQVQVPDSAELDFRDVEILPDGSILLMSIGNGEASKVFRSTDGGKSWQVVLQNHDANAFFDGMAFHPDGKRGALFGDPIAGALDVYWTDDSGASWRRTEKSKGPRVWTGEIGFAASGTGIHWTESGLRIATGGSVARIHHTTDEGRSWRILRTPIMSQRKSAGIFSMAIADDQIVLVGGDYLSPDETGLNVAVSTNGGRSFRLPKDNSIGHKACVRFLNDASIVCCGRTGVDISMDGGATWKHLTDTAYYTMDLDDAAATVMLAGPNGHVGRLEMGR